MRYHGCHLRRGRFSQPGQCYLITTVTANRQPLFTNLYTGRWVVRAIAGEQTRADTLCYVVMPDHLHWLFMLREDTLSAVVRNVKSISAHHINKMTGHSGPVWQRGFHDHAVRREEDLRSLARYVIANPLRAGLVQSVREYALWDAAWL